ncbi:MAG: LysM peptidoglycan-binding domain-containing protein [Peptococcales bacterium]|jgi:LysM repeat protein
MATYIVQRGDTLSGIAKKLGIPNWRTLYEQNKAVIGSNPNLIRPGQKLSYGEILAQSTPAPASVGTGATELATQIAQEQPINFAEVLPWEQYFTPELARGSAEQVYAQYFAPIAQQRQEQLESNFAGRNLIRSGIRGQSLSDLYRELGQEHQKGIEADVLQQQAMAREDYNRLMELYEKSAGKQKPATTKYTPYKVARPVTDAGTYGSSYLDWLNRATRV